MDSASVLLQLLTSTQTVVVLLVIHLDFGTLPKKYVKLVRVLIIGIVLNLNAFVLRLIPMWMPITTVSHVLQMEYGTQQQESVILVLLVSSLTVIMDFVFALMTGHSSMLVTFA
jgi:hypothetical protein